MDESDSDALGRLLSHVSWADNLLNRAQTLKEANITGIGKLTKKIHAERTFVKSLNNGSIALKENQLKSTNLSHLEGVLHSAESFNDVVGILHPVHYQTAHGEEVSMLVDVVADGGRTWVKVTARKAKALHRIWKGEGEYGDHDIVEQAKRYLRATQQHPVNYQPPTVHVVFYGGITQDIVDDLAQLDIESHGQVFQSVGESLEATFESPMITEPKTPAIAQSINVDKQKVNLDVTTLVALVSDLTHGGCWHNFTEKLIQELAEQEKKNPVVKDIEEFLKGKELIACKTAITDFQNILETIAGPSERERAKELLERITTVEDDPSKQANQLEESHRIKHRAKVIFGTGDKLKAITITANEGFIRAARNKGVSFAVHIHQSRALTEKKRFPNAHASQSAPKRPTGEAMFSSDMWPSQDMPEKNRESFRSRSSTPIPVF